eukprot:4180748-Pyramimonas_sp.AAC.1
MAAQLPDPVLHCGYCPHAPPSAHTTELRRTGDALTTPTMRASDREKMFETVGHTNMRMQRGRCVVFLFPLGLPLSVAKSS